MDRTDRAVKIEDAAYKMLKEKGFKGASMLAIAKEAKASNETLYNWYGDKTGLFAAMIGRNANLVVETLQKAQMANRSKDDALRDVSCSLLTMVTSDKAVALNKAAAGDLTGKLGAILAQEGRERVAPLMSKLLTDVVGDAPDIEDLTDCFLSLLIGDLQIKRATSAIKQPTADQIAIRANNAISRVQKIFLSRD